MKNGVTLVLLAAVGILAALALADTLRPSGETKPETAPSTTQATTTRTEPRTLRETLREEAVTGFILYSDQDCRLHSLVLPRMVDDVIREENGSTLVYCRFSVDRGRILRGHANQVAGGLSVRDGQVVDGDRELLSGADLRRAARRNPTIAGLSREFPLRVRVTSLGRLVGAGVVVGLKATMRGVDRPLWLAALFSGQEIQSIATSSSGPYRNFFASADGALLGADNGTVFTRTGKSFDPASQVVPAGRAIAFSPDDRWIVRVNGTSTFLVGAPEGGRASRVIRLPIPARDLVWEAISAATSVGPPIRR